MIIFFFLFYVAIDFFSAYFSSSYLGLAVRLLQTVFVFLSLAFHVWHDFLEEEGGSRELCTLPSCNWQWLTVFKSSLRCHRSVKPSPITLPVHKLLLSWTLYRTLMAPILLSNTWCLILPCYKMCLLQVRKISSLKISLSFIRLCSNQSCLVYIVSIWELFTN